MFPDWIYRQSAVLPYRRRHRELEVLLITSRRGTRWIVPKGIVEPGMTPAASAAKEAWEEAGVEGQVSEPALGRYRYRKWGGTCTVDVFPMLVTSELADWPEAAFRRREWLAVEAAVRRLDSEDLKAIVARLPAAIEDGAVAPPRSESP